MLVNNPHAYSPTTTVRFIHRTPSSQPSTTIITTVHKDWNFTKKKKQCDTCGEQVTRHSFSRVLNRQSSCHRLPLWVVRAAASLASWKLLMDEISRHVGLIFVHGDRREIHKQTEVGFNKGVFDKQIRLRISSPNVLDIILVDQPGLTKNHVGDPDGYRTTGVITKLDIK